jgi:hypothetical protein
MHAVGSCVTSAIPESSASRGVENVCACPSMRISPALGWIAPARIFASVDLPEPFSPDSETISPFAIEKSTSRSA